MSSASADERVGLAVLDFKIQTDNPKYAGLGKGISVFLAEELRTAPEVSSPGWMERNQMLGVRAATSAEISEADDLKSVARILSVRYIVTGNVVYIDNAFTITVMLFDAREGIASSDYSVSDHSRASKSITAKLAVRILDALGVAIPPELSARARAASLYPLIILMHFSDALTAYERGDYLSAWRSIKSADTLDPGNTSLVAMLNLVHIRQSQLIELSDPPFPLHNPAFLGIIQTDNLDIVLFREHFENNQFSLNNDIIMRLGYQFPIGDGGGVGVDGFCHLGQEIFDAVPTDVFEHTLNVGGSLSAGWSPASWLSLGLSVSLFAAAQPQSLSTTFPTAFSFRQAVSGGILFKNPESTFIYELRCDVDFDFVNLRDGTTGLVVGDAPRPFFIDQSLTLSLLGRRLLLVLRQSNSLVLTREYYFGRLLAGIEVWFVRWLGLRIAGEGTLGLTGQDLQLNIGGLAGVRVRIPTPGGGGWDFDIGIVYRQRPSERVYGKIINQFGVYVNLIKSQILFSR